MPEYKDIVHMPQSLYQGDPISRVKDKYFKERMNRFEVDIESKKKLTRKDKIRSIVAEKEKKLHEYIGKPPRIDVAASGIYDAAKMDVIAGKNQSVKYAETLYCAVTIDILQKLREYLRHKNNPALSVPNLTAINLAVGELTTLRDYITAVQALHNNPKNPRSRVLIDHFNDDIENITRLEWLVNTMVNKSGASLAVEGTGGGSKLPDKIKLNGMEYNYTKNLLKDQQVVGLYTSRSGDNVVIKRKNMTLDAASVTRCVNGDVQSIVGEADMGQKFSDMDHIARELGYDFSDIAIAASQDDYQANSYIAMPYYRSTLRNALEDRTDPANRLTFNRNQRGRIFFDVISGMAQLHDRGYIHRDFKPDNIFIDDDDQVFIGDLGSCVKGAVESDSNEGLTPSYYNQNDLDQNLYDNKSEVYALGITFIELITGRRIVNYLTGVNYVKGAPEHQIIRNVLDDEVRKGSVSRKAADCLLTMVHPDRSQRPDIVRVAREFAAESIQSDDVMLFIGNLKAVGKSNNEIRSSIEHLKSIGVPIVDSDIANLAEIDDKFDAEKDRVNKAVRANPDIKEFNNPKRYSGIGVCAVPSFNEAQNKWEFKVTNILKPGSAEKCGCKIGDVITVAGYDKTQLKEAATLVRETGIGQNNAVISTNASLTEPLVKPAIFVFENNTKKYKLDKFGVDKAIDPSSIFRPTSSAHFLSSAGRTI